MTTPTPSASPTLSAAPAPSAAPQHLRITDTTLRDGSHAMAHQFTEEQVRVANSVLAYQHGARQVDGALCALGAGAGNSPTEVLAATFDHLGVPTGVDVGGVLAAAEEVVRPFLPRWPKMDRSAIVQGWAGVYSSFLLHAERAAERYGVPAHEILQRAGELGYVGGQEDMIIDIAVRLAQERDLAAAGAR